MISCELGRKPMRLLVASREGWRSSTVPDGSGSSRGTLALLRFG
jgi:hypothetical protein